MPNARARAYDRHKQYNMIAFLRRHYPDQVRGTGRLYVSSQPACASAPWIVLSVYHHLPL